MRKQTSSFSKRLSSMCRADARRMGTSPLVFVCLGTAFVLPVLILVMTTMAGGTAVTDPTTGAVTTLEPFTNAWQIIARTREGGGMSMDLTSLCNMNLIYLLTGVFLCLFVAADFQSGFAKNLFTVRARKTDYVASKTILGVLAGSLFLLAFLAGTVLGGSLAGLSFDLSGAGLFGLVLCLLSKLFLMGVFVPIFLLASVFGKRRAWLSILLALFAGMLLFLMIPMMTPLDAGIGNAGMCLAGGLLFAAGLGAASNGVLKRTSLA